MRNVTESKSDSRFEKVDVLTHTSQNTQEFLMIDRPENLIGTTTRVKTACGNLYVTVNNLDNKPIEVFARLGHSGGCASSMLQMMCRLASLSLQAGVSPEIIIKAGLNISCPNPVFGNNYLGDKQITSCADAICKVLKNAT